MNRKRMGKVRREAQFRGQIEITGPQLEKFIIIHKRFTGYAENWRFRNEKANAYLPVSRFQVKELEDLVGIMEKSSPRPKSTISQIQQHLEVLRKPGGTKISSLSVLETALKAFLKRDIIQGWVFYREKDRNYKDKQGPMVAGLIDSIVYYPTQHHKGYIEPAHTVLNLNYWSKGKNSRHTITWHADDLGRTVEEMFLNENLVKETKELVDTYIKDETQFLKWRSMLGEQFIGNGIFEAEKSTWQERDYELSQTKLIVDDRCDTIDNRRQSSLFAEIVVDPDDYSGIGDDGVEDATMDSVEKYNRVPLRFYIWCFNLASHREGFVHMSHMEPYVYRPEIREKLILPEEHSDLIDALTSNIQVLQEDIVLGKTGGTTIICQGKAGTGKTLTAEVYSEVMQRPLYRIHSGQLGIDAEGVESELNKALDNSKRWRAILLIDEADVFLMKRGENLDLNAVVGVFLRVLEYYDGLIFLTTNRTDDIDDAILSRCIARITFEAPGLEERIQLWETLGAVYKVKLVKRPGMLEKLAKAFPGASGRDIKGLIRLGTRFAANLGREPTFDDIKRLSKFRGM